MNTPHLPTIVAATKAVHEQLRASVELLRQRLGERAERLSGLCATGAYMLRDELRRSGLQARVCVARAVYGNAVHLWVEVEGVHADPTYLQFNSAQPWRVSLEAPPVSYHGKPCTWAPEGLPQRWQRSQHPEEIYSLLGLGSWTP